MGGGRSASMRHQRGTRLRLGERDVGQPLRVKSQHLQVHHPIDEHARTPDELILVGDEGEHQADRKGTVQHTCGAEPDDQDLQHSHEQRIARPEQEPELFGRQLPVGRLHQKIQPMSAAILLPVEQLDGANAAKGFEEVTVEPRLPHDGLRRGLPEGRIQAQRRRA